MHDGENNNPIAINEVKDAMRKSSQQSPPGTRSLIHRHTRSRLGFNPGKGVSDLKQELLRSTHASLTIPCHRLRDVILGLCCEDKLHRYKPCCFRMESSATAHETTEPGFCR